ncbi:DsbA family protein [Streptomyces sp. NPDC006879]|uniref:DsbA family protein n=1 Tax=Streptomyces sp. NPDC006879 TaxID=3364767 RepID=UPI0036C2BE79
MSSPQKHPKTSGRPKKGASGTSAAKPLLVGAGIAVAAVLLGLASYQATAPERSTESGATSVAQREQPTDAQRELSALARRDSGDPMARGRVDAPVVLIEYADFRCGYCGKFARDTAPQLVEKYVENGTLRIEWRNYPIFGAESEAAAKAAWAAGRQGRFWEFHRAAFAEDAKEKGFGERRLLELAGEAGVADLARFKKDLGSTAAEQALARDTGEGNRIGVTSTPSFLVNGQPLAGAQPLAAFERAIGAAKAAAGAAAAK